MTAKGFTYVYTWTPLSEGIINFTIRATDTLMNTATASGSFVVIADAWDADTQPPVISNVSTSEDSNGITVTWTTDEAADSAVEFGLDERYSSVLTDNELTTIHSLYLTDLIEGAAYFYRVKSEDAYGNETYSQEDSFVP